MSIAVQDMLKTFEQLPEPEQREFVAIILRRAVEMEMLLPSDDEFAGIAEELFLVLDAEENHNEGTATR